MAQQTPAPITWEAPEYPHYEKNIGWYVTLFAVSLLIVAYFAFHDDYFAAVTTAILAGFVFYFARQRPRQVLIELTHQSIKFGRITYPYKQLKYFWIVNTPHHKTVNFGGTTYLNNTIILELVDQDPDEIRAFLLQYLPEHTETEATLAQRISHRLRF